MPPRAQSSVSVPDRLTAWLGPRAREGILGACFTGKAALHCPWCESPDSPSPCNPSLARCRECREKDAGLCSSGILYLNKSVNIMRHLTYGRHQSWPLSRIPWLLQATCDSLALAPYPLSLCRHRGCELSHAPEAAQGHGRAGLGQSWGSWPASAQGEETEQKPQPQAALREGSPGRRQRGVGRQGPRTAGQGQRDGHRYQEQLWKSGSGLKGLRRAPVLSSVPPTPPHSTERALHLLSETIFPGLTSGTPWREGAGLASQMGNPSLGEENSPAMRSSTTKEFKVHPGFKLKSVLGPCS